MSAIRFSNKEFLEINTFMQLLIDWLVDDNSVLTKNWIVWNRTDYLYKNGYGFK